jgi:hypothetical protein
LKKVVSRIVRLQPNVVIAQRAVARIALDLICASGITLMLNVKSNVVDYIARLTQATVLETVEQLSMTPQLGQCGLFELREFATDDSGVKTLAVFEGCAPELGCTVVLRGPNTYNELVKAKSVLRFLSFTAYHLQLESALCNEECIYLPNEEFLASLERKARQPSLHLQLATLNDGSTPEPREGDETPEVQEVLVVVDDDDGKPGKAIFDNVTLSPQTEAGAIKLNPMQAQLPVLLGKDLFVLPQALNSCGLRYSGRFVC